jgi:sugar-specific transcriptional regulator TrmB
MNGYAEKKDAIPPELLKEVAYWAGRLHEGELNDEVEEVWERIEREASPRVKELLKEIDGIKELLKEIEHPLEDWAEVREVYENGFWSYVWESDGRNPEYAGYWYLKPDGTIDYFEVSSEVVLSPVGTKSEWTPKALIKAYEKITRAIDNAHPLSGTALYESAVENWIKEELRSYLEEKVKEAVRTIGVFPETKEEALKLADRIKEELSKEGIPRSLLESVVGDGEIAELAVEVEPDEPEEPDEDYDFSP